jgi:hypothetical protein
MVAQRAGMRCEYCLTHIDDASFAHEVDHILSRQHGGETVAENLAFAFMICNRLKGSNLTSVTSSGELVRLFNPRLDHWKEHFKFEGAVIQPLSLIGEVTTRLLRLNDAERVVERVRFQGLGTYPRG